MRASSVVGAGTLVGGPQMLPMTTGYGPERRHGGLMDPRRSLWPKLPEK